MADFPQASADYVASLEGEDFLNGGHRTAFPLSLESNLELIQFARLVAIELVALAEQVEADAASAAAGSGSEATVAQIWAGAAAQFLSIRRVMAAQERQVIAFATPLAWDMTDGSNFLCTLSADTTLPNPTESVPGSSGFIDFVQASAGKHEITAYGSNFKWFGSTPEWPSSVGAVSKVTYYVAAPGEIHLAFAGSAL